MQSFNNTLEVQDFLFLFSTHDSILTLEAQQKSTGKTFIIQLENSLVGQSTNGLFNNKEEMIEGFRKAIHGNGQDLKLAIDFQGKLTYTAKIPWLNKEISFTLDLCEKVMELSGILNNQLKFFKDETGQWRERQEMAMETLQTRNEERLDEIENMMIRMEQNFVHRLETLERLCCTLKASIPLKIDSSFNSASVYASKWNLTNDNKTATSVEGGYPLIEILPAVPSNGVSSYMLRINKDSTNKTCIGITAETRNVVYWNQDHLNYRYWTHDGKIYGRVRSQPTGNAPYGGKDAIIKMVVDMDQGTLTFFVDNRPINFCPISKSDKYFAYFCVDNIGDSVTLL